ncbi:PHP domain-containing protein [Paenibacillus lentus]|uniref:PHP domain-containing protein n=1 Tax=Paenibacillus lentus TaxID=1338368 RepID=A0A3S8RPT2_9BACL|nr:PHP-associated domain-containing protein [Paenibacillus lentus]AZK44970.1 PHP domain-containing protein [Paenibacillus lentus]
MRIDLHTHVKLAKKTVFSHAYFKEMMAEAGKSGLDAVAMTEHFNTLRYEDIYQVLDRHYPYEQGYYLAEGMKVFPGIEVDIQETGHILLIGDRERVLELRKRLEPYTEKGRFIEFQTLLDWSEGQGFLRIGAHPFRIGTPLHHLPEELLGRLDAFDLNGKDIYSQGLETYRSRIDAFALGLGRPVVGGSDTHQFMQYGSVVNEFAQEAGTAEELRELIRRGAYKVEVSPCLDVKVKSANLIKSLLKKELAISGEGGEDLRELGEMA